MLWPARPKPFVDESFPSWFLRLARANGVSQQELWKTLCPGQSFSLPYIHTQARPALLAQLTEYTGLSGAAVDALFLPAEAVFASMRDQRAQRYCSACLLA